MGGGNEKKRREEERREGDGREAGKARESGRVAICALSKDLARRCVWREGDVGRKFVGRSRIFLLQSM